VSSAFSSRIVAALEKPIGAATFTRNTQKVVVKKVVVANKRSVVKSENEDLIVAVLVVSLALAHCHKDADKSNDAMPKGRRRFGGKKDRKKERNETPLVDMV
jgi:hypothetical protein